MILRRNTCRKWLLAYVHASSECSHQHSVPGSAGVVVVVIVLLSSILKTHAGTTWSIHNKMYVNDVKSITRNPMAARTASN